MLIDGQGCWLSRTSDRSWAQGVPALFVDRDGFLTHDPGYLCDADDVRLLPGAADLLRAANRAAWPVIVVTNQSGIARGLFGWSAFESVDRRLRMLLAEEGASYDAVLACAWCADGQGSLAQDHPWRKPRPGMLHAAAEHFHVDLARSWLGGDRATDMMAAIGGDLQGGLLLREGAVRLTDSLLTVAGGGVRRFHLVCASRIDEFAAWAEDCLWGASAATTRRLQ